MEEDTSIQQVALKPKISHSDANLSTNELQSITRDLHIPLPSYFLHDQSRSKRKSEGILDYQKPSTGSSLKPIPKIIDEKLMLFKVLERRPITMHLDSDLKAIPPLRPQSLRSHAKEKMAFGKEDTGRLNKLPDFKSKMSPALNVLMKGARVAQVIGPIAPPESQQTKPDPVVNRKVEIQITQNIVPLCETITIPTISPLIPDAIAASIEFGDIGGYEDVIDVDEVLSRYSTILLERKRTLQLGILGEGTIESMEDVPKYVKSHRDERNRQVSPAIEYTVDRHTVSAPELAIAREDLNSVQAIPATKNNDTDPIPQYRSSLVSGNRTSKATASKLRFADESVTDSYDPRIDRDTSSSYYCSSSESKRSKDSQVIPKSESLSEDIELEIGFDGVTTSPHTPSQKISIFHDYIMSSGESQDKIGSHPLPEKKVTEKSIDRLLPIIGTRSYPASNSIKKIRTDLQKVRVARAIEDIMSNLLQTSQPTTISSKGEGLIDCNLLNSTAMTATPIAITEPLRTVVIQAVKKNNAPDQLHIGTPQTDDGYITEAESGALSTPISKERKKRVRKRKIYRERKKFLMVSKRRIAEISEEATGLAKESKIGENPILKYDTNRKERDAVAKDSNFSTIQYQKTQRPVIGLSAGSDHKVINIRNECIRNGYTSDSLVTLYTIVHNKSRRLSSFSEDERLKYPTLEDKLKSAAAIKYHSSTSFNSTILSDLQRLNDLIAKVPLFEYYMERGWIYAGLKNIAHAVLDFNICVALGINYSLTLEPFNIDGYWYRHQAFLLLNDAEHALFDLNRIIEIDKRNTGALQAGATIYAALGIVDLALVQYSSILKINPNSGDAIYHRACLYARDGQISNSNGDFKVVRVIDPSNEHAILNLALILFEKGLWSDSVTVFSKLIVLDREDSTYLVYRARAYAALSFFQEAFTDLSAAVRISPNLSLAYFHRGCLLRTVASGKAIQDFSISIILDGLCDSFYHRGLMYERTLQYEAAVADFMCEPNMTDALLSLGIVLMLKIQNYLDAYEYLTRAIASDPVDVRGYISRGELYELKYKQTLEMELTSSIVFGAKKKDTALSYAKLAIRDYCRAIHLRPSKYLLYLYRGRILLKQLKIDDATTDFQAAFNINSNIAQTFVQRALILSFQQKHQQIIAEYDLRKENGENMTDVMLILLVAKAKVRYGDYIGALKDLLLADNKDNDAEIALQKGICYQFIGSWSLACIEFTNCVLQMPKCAKPYYHLGVCKLADNDPTGQNDLNEALLLDPKYFDAYIARATFYESSKLFEKGVLDCNEALVLEPTSTKAYILRSACQCKLGQYSLAIAGFTRAATIDRCCVSAYYNRAVAHQCLIDYSSALKDYGIVLLINDRDLICIKSRALLYLSLGDDDNAVIDLNIALQIEPQNSKVRTMLGYAYQKVGLLDEGCYEYSRAIEVEKTVKDAILGRGNVFLEKGQSVHSKRDYSRVLHMYPTCTESLINIAILMQKDAHLSAAWHFFTMAYSIDNLSVDSMKGRATVNHSLGNHFAAFLDISRALEIKPNNAELLTYRGFIYQALDDNPSALQSYQLAIERDPCYSPAYYNAGNHYLRQHSWSNAISKYSCAVKYDRQDYRSFMNRGLAWMMVDELQKARKDFEFVIELVPTSFLGHYSLAYLFGRLEMYQEAECEISKAIDLSNDGAAYEFRAKVRSKLGKWNIAMTDHITSTETIDHVASK